MLFKRRRTFVVVLVSLLATLASANGGLRFGVGLNPIDLVASANVSVPLFRTGEAQHAARADVSYAFSGLPAVSATYLLQDAAAGSVQTYVGVGAGLAFLDSLTGTPAISLHALAGANTRIIGGLGAYGEVTVGGNAIATTMQIGLGLSYTLGGNY